MFSISNGLPPQQHSQTQAGSAHHDAMLLKARALLAAGNMSSNFSLSQSFPLASRAAMLSASHAAPAPAGGDNRNSQLLELLLKVALASPPAAPAPAVGSPPLSAVHRAPAPFSHNRQPHLTTLAAGSALRRTITPPVTTVPTIMPPTGISKTTAAAISSSSPPKKPVARFAIAQAIRQQTRVSMTRSREEQSASVTTTASRPMKKRRVMLEASSASFPLPSVTASATKSVAKTTNVPTLQAKWNAVAKSAASSKHTTTKRQQQALARELFQRSLGKTL